MWLRMRVRIVSAPRASGDGPRPSSRECQTCRCSPRERGWPPSPGTDSVTRRVLPARAGMAPLESSTHERRHRAPRASGDGPPTQPAQSLPPECSPRERGWPAARGPVVRQQAVLPARAGMAPSRALGATWICGAPRASGDGPRALDVLDSQDACSPRERGWPLAHPCGAGAGPVLPARAGMAPAAPPSPSPTSGAPRASGDGPEAVGAALSGGGCSPRERGWPGGPHGHHLPASVLPARAGMALNPSLGLLGIVRAPRASGDGPASDAALRARGTCSPRERGWPRVGCGATGAGYVLPARAGMAPKPTHRQAAPHRAPRASGDGPHGSPCSSVSTRCSPRERGWPAQGPPWPCRHRVLPARAGMAPARAAPREPWMRAPRASGDGPGPAVCDTWLLACSPRERGWPGVGADRDPRGDVLPARAGMAPPSGRPPRGPCCAPRASGDAPPGTLASPKASMCSPRERGWPGDGHRSGRSPHVLPARAGMAPADTDCCALAVCAPRASGDGPSASNTLGPSTAVLPARAGMARRSRTRRSPSRSAPRASGDGPAPTITGPTGAQCSPRERGWPDSGASRVVVNLVLPARAGMARRLVGCAGRAPRAPRASGDGPPRSSAWPRAVGCSPRERGCPPPGTPTGTVAASAPRASGDGPQFVDDALIYTSCSPRERGWPRERRATRRVPDGSPRERGWPRPPRHPRAATTVLPARAGMARSATPRRHPHDGAPRASGDGPPASASATTANTCSPRERGWPSRGGLPGVPPRVLPARAGMARSRRAPGSRPPCAPRASGDGPIDASTAGAGAGCSPRERGWPPARRAPMATPPVLPARAGMARRLDVPPAEGDGAPRASGDGPVSSGGAGPALACSPRERGWPPFLEPFPEPFRVLPARAGMALVDAAATSQSGGAPRASGDGPGGRGRHVTEWRCSPRERGWPVVVGRELGDRRVLPARAGMAPGPSACARRAQRAPRASGDGPRRGRQPLRRVLCSPRERGWPG